MLKTGIESSLSLEGMANEEAQLSGSEIGQLEQGLSGFGPTFWPKGQNINVCWENVDPNHKYAIEVREVVNATWNAVFDYDLAPGEGIRFTGWGRCQKGEKGIRIKVADSTPKVNAFGKDIDGMPNGMILNFKFIQFNPFCALTDAKRRKCIRSVAVHEFGHALGFTHEQNRTDTPKTCQEEMGQDQTGITNIGPWDRFSIMNYCNPAWNGQGTLSGLDMLGVRYLYAPVIGENFCQQLVDVMDHQEAVYKYDTVPDEDMEAMFDELFSDVK